MYLKSASLFQIITENINQSYKSRGGGVAMLIRNGISFRHIKCKKIAGIDALIIDVSTTRFKYYIRLVLVYRPPSISNQSTQSLIKVLQKISEESLVLRRTLYDLSTIFRLTKNFTHLDPTCFVEFSTRPIRNKHNLQLRVPKKISKTEHWIINRTINLWNVLPIQIINSPNPKSFWINLRTYLIQNQDLLKDFIGHF
uniref:Uncharacterized protein n=1 Tax=Meloidogyne enterolobii TaxID=390850 RepID=A0A6V7U0M7_MELEN|nr:unnamed protein product [Meloidogyne enterolobii]